MRLTGLVFDDILHACIYDLCALWGSNGVRLAPFVKQLIFRKGEYR